MIEPERLTFIDVVASTHNHTDHFDTDTLHPLLAANPNLTLIVPEANRMIAGDRMKLSAKRFLGIDEAQTLSAAGFEFTAIPAAHETIERDEWGSLRFVGYVVRCGPWTIYHSGDTVLYEGMTERLADWRIDVALLPINGRDPARRVAGNLWGREAADLAHRIGAAWRSPAITRCSSSTRPHWRNSSPNAGVWAKISACSCRRAMERVVARASAHAAMHVVSGSPDADKPALWQGLPTLTHTSTAGLQLVAPVVRRPSVGAAAWSADHAATHSILDSMEQAAERRWLIVVYAATIFLSALLLFQVQPIISRYVLPWFGGTPAVWTTAMLFFQTLLFVGYAYAHLSVHYIKPQWQVGLQLVLLAAAIVSLPFVPHSSWKPVDGAPRRCEFCCC